MNKLTDEQIPHLTPTGDKTYDVDADMWLPTTTRQDEIRLVRAAIEQHKAQRQAEPESRHILQADGKHPAPCAKFCEATAFKHEIRRLEREVEAQRQAGQEPVAWQDRAGKLHLRYRDAVLDFEREPVPLFAAPQPAQPDQAAEIAQLQDLNDSADKELARQDAEIAALKDKYENLDNKAIAEISRLSVQIAALRQDAERYRFAAEHLILGGGSAKFGWPIAPACRSEWDRYLDKAIAQAVQHG